MTTVILLFTLAFLAGAAAQHGRLGPSSASRKLAMVLALAFTIAYFGYVVGKDLAKRDNLSAGGAGSSFTVGQSRLP